LEEWETAVKADGGLGPGVGSAGDQTGAGAAEVPCEERRCECIGVFLKLGGDF